MSRLLAPVASGLCLLLPAAAAAHDGPHAAGGFGAGFLHPFGGLDHLLAMVAVGLFAALLGGRARWLVPGAFVAVLALGGGLAMAGIALPMVETGIALSVLLLGLAVALRLAPATAAAMAVVGLFALFHGHAHGAEMPAAASALPYALGFVLATALLHAAGLAAGLGFGRAGAGLSGAAYRAGGGAIALAGAGLLSGLI